MTTPPDRAPNASACVSTRPRSSRWRDRLPVCRALSTRCPEPSSYTFDVLVVRRLISLCDDEPAPASYRHTPVSRAVLAAR